MKILVSACLAGENCKYNGGNNLNEKVLQLMKEHEVVTICPEVMGGLPTPRVPAEVVMMPKQMKDDQVDDRYVEVVMTKDGRSVDAEFRRGAELALEVAMKEKPDLIVLQSRSPSCGVNERYDGTFAGKRIRKSGVTAQLLMENGFKVIDVEDL